MNSVVNGPCLDACSLYRAEDALRQAAAQLNQVEERNGRRGLWAEELEDLHKVTNRVIAVRDCLLLTATPQTLVRDAIVRAAYATKERIR